MSGSLPLPYLCGNERLAGASEAGLATSGWHTQKSRRSRRAARTRCRCPSSMSPCVIGARPTVAQARTSMRIPPSIRWLRLLTRSPRQRQASAFRLRDLLGLGTAMRQAVERPLRACQTHRQTRLSRKVQARPCERECEERLHRHRVGRARKSFRLLESFELIAEVVVMQLL